MSGYRWLGNVIQTKLAIIFFIPVNFIYTEISLGSCALDMNLDYVDTMAKFSKMETIYRISSPDSESYLSPTPETNNAVRVRHKTVIMKVKYFSQSTNLVYAVPHNQESMC